MCSYYHNNNISSSHLCQIQMMVVLRKGLLLPKIQSLWVLYDNHYKILLVSICYYGHTAVGEKMGTIHMFLHTYIRFVLPLCSECIWILPQTHAYRHTEATGRASCKRFSLVKRQNVFGLGELGWEPDSAAECNIKPSFMTSSLFSMHYFTIMRWEILWHVPFGLLQLETVPC